MLDNVNILQSSMVSLQNCYIMFLISTKCMLKLELYDIL